MWWVNAFLFFYFAQTILCLEPKSFSTLQSQKDGYSSGGDSGDSSIQGNGYPKLTPKLKKTLERCFIDPFLKKQLDCGNNPYSGLVRLSFHDCATFDATETDPAKRGGCNAWMTQKCTEVDKCEFTSLDNNGLQKWVIAIDDVYDNAKLKGDHLSKYLTRADFWHLAAFRAIHKSSSGQVPLTYHGGREDPDMPESPRFPDRIPDADAWENMLHVVHRNGMDDVAGAALIGAHTLGGCHPQNMGYQGAWDSTPFVFDAGFWKNLLDETWFVHTIQSINSLTGKPQEETQFSLAEPNFDRSVMLFSDMGSHIDLTDPTCDVKGDEVAQGTCPLQPTPPGMQDIFRFWADQPDTFFSAFADAYETMNQWGCDDCYSVDEYKGDINCPSYTPSSCQPFYPQVTYSYNPTPSPTPAPYASTPTPTHHHRYGSK